MSAISAELRAAARSAYRELYRVSTATFAGDNRVLTAFREKMRTETLEGRLQMDPRLYEEKLKYSREVAEILRKNVVQAQTNDDGDTWQVRLNERTELGDNETIKSPVFESSRSARKQAGAADAAQPDPPARNIPRYYSALKRAHQKRKIPELNEDDLEESFVRGSGPGGQSINKTENNVQLLHKPTGIRVSCQETRSLQLNRMYARRLIIQKLDQLQNPGLSKEEMKRAKQIERERRRRKKAKKRDLERKAKAEHSQDN